MKLQDILTEICKVILYRVYDLDLVRADPLGRCSLLHV